MRCLRFDIIRDLVTDTRSFAQRAQHDWAERSRDEIRLLFPKRHTMRLDPFGWPVALRERELIRYRERVLP